MNMAEQVEKAGTTATATPRVSVVTSYYNRRDFLEPTIRSILDQSFTDLELLVFDDCSPDGTGERLMELVEEIGDPRLKPILHERNKGFTRGMIEAIARTRSEFIAVQGSGDISLPERIAKQVALLDAEPGIGAVGCHYTNVVAENGARRPRTPDAGNATMDSLIRENVFSHGEVMFRRSVYDLAGGYRAPFVNSQDIDLWLRIIRHARLGTVPEQLYERYVRMDGVSYAPKKFAVQARYSMLARRFARMPSEQAEAELARLAEHGPLVLVPHEDPELQHRYVLSVLRSIVWGATDEACELARGFVANPLKRTGLIAAAKVLGTPVARPVLRMVQKSFDVQ
jgi:glycosyltransferase involved in cell wall biosynthesis